AIEDRAQRSKALAARRFLLNQEDCSYVQFEAEHHEFLEKHPAATERQRRRRLQFIEAPAVETAAWPHLFFSDGMCLTAVRNTDIRRRGRAAGPTLEEFVRGRPRSRADSEDEEEDNADGQRHSVKRAYAALAVCARIGYGSSYEVLHFAYDLTLWSALGAKKRTSTDWDIPMRVLIKGHSFSPLYWRSVHWALIDLVRQMGYPKVFWTMSPYEFSMPYHAWLLDELAKDLRGRLHLAVPESLHVTHVLLQVIRGLLAGKTGVRSKDPWKRHLLQALDADGRPHPVQVFLRVEFQDGTRKAPTQDYHGSGRPHVHVLIFCSSAAVAAMSLPQAVSAAMPEPEDEADIFPGVVRSSQCDRSGRSGWPVESQDNRWDAEAKKLRLRHPPADHARGLRPFFVDVLDALRCHQDFQFADDDGALRAYVAKYVSKFSDASQEEWLNDKASGDSIAATVLCRYKPLEPEMALQMFGARFRQWFVTTETRGKRDFVVPWPEKDLQPKEVQLYMDAGWAAGKISLLDFLRKTGSNGQILAWLKKLHAASGSDESLGDFAAQYSVQGEKVVAAECLSKFNDLFFGQWLMLHVPFTDPRDFVVPVAAQLAKVPEEHRCFAMAMLCEHPIALAMWHSEAAIEEELRMEATSKPFVQTTLAMIAAHRQLVQDYVAGRLDAAAEAAAREAAKEQARPDGAGHLLAFNRQQRHLQGRVDEAVDRSLRARCAESEAAADELLEQAYKDGKIFVCTGGPGTGKTTVALACLTRAVELGGKVLFAYPTNRQASRMRARLPEEVAVDTYHAAFGLDEEPGSVVVALSHYDLVLIDEISHLQAEHFEHICRLWNQADNLPAILLTGDELQLSGFGERRAWHSRMWKGMTFRAKLHEVYRCKDPEFNAILQELRTSRPSAKTLKWLQKRKAWTPPHKLDVSAARKLLKSHPDTVVLTCTRKGAQTINELALQALFPRFPPLAVLDGDVASNPENYHEGALLEDLRALRPLRLPIFKGMRAVFTRNVRKDVDFVNGMDCVVQGSVGRTKAVEVLTATNHRVMVWPWTEPELGNLSYYPLKAGYADTIIKYQGAELKHVTAFLDCPGIPGAAYTALRRVSFGKDLLVGGVVTAAHFQPVDES
ncbi:unnamed protein product, partial [Durusdinium trenchii]